MTIDSGLLAPPALLRTLRPGDAPFPGDLRAGDPPTVWVPADRLPAELWSVRDGEHVLAPVDLARTTDGHAALFPHCPERLTTVIARGSATRTPGAVVTVAVSLLRGAAEAERCGITEGCWWVDAAGRPVLAAAGGSWRDESVALLSDLAADAPAPLHAALHDAAALLAEQRPSGRRREEAEEALFAAAEPAPLRIEAPHPSAVTPPPSRATSLRPADDDGAAVVPPRDPPWATQLVDGELLTRVRGAVSDLIASTSRTVDALRSRRRSSVRVSGRAGVEAATSGRVHRRRRGMPVVVATAVGVAVVAAGLSWPSGDEVPVAATLPPGLPGGSSAASAAPTGEDAAAPHPSSASPASTARAGSDHVDRLLTALSSCARNAEPGCGGILEDATAPPPTGVVANDSVDRAAALLDEYGGVSVYRVFAEGLPTQVLVLVDVNGRWLVRDVYDVADQP